MGRKHHARRHRRQRKMKLASRGKFKVNHKAKTGRTGHVHEKRTKSKQPLGLRVVLFFDGGPAWWKLGY